MPHLLRFTHDRTSPHVTLHVILSQSDHECYSQHSNCISHAYQVSLPHISIKVELELVEMIEISDSSADELYGMVDSHYKSFLLKQIYQKVELNE